MLSTEQNENLTRVGPGTPMGNLLRQYWHPVATLSDMRTRWTKRVRLLGEDLVLYRDRRGSFGLISERCPHRSASFAYGIPEPEGIRCPYHGWLFDHQGACLEQPNEPEDSTFKERVKTTAYPVRELGGLLFAYMGPDPVPEVPPYDGFVMEPAVRVIGYAMLPCNWLQPMENSMDPVHTEWLHGHYQEFLKEDEGVRVPFSRHHIKIAFDPFDHGLVKRRLLEGQAEDVDDWTVGHPVVFPNILAVGGGGLGAAFQIRVPVDDTHTWHVWYRSIVPPNGGAVPESLQNLLPFEVPVFDQEGGLVTDFVDGQDVMAWVTQGDITNRTVEHLGTTDRGVILYRQMLKEQMEKVEMGQDPINVFRGSNREMVVLPTEKNKHHFNTTFRQRLERGFTRYAPYLDDLIDLFAAEDERRAVGG